MLCLSLRSGGCRAVLRSTLAAQDCRSLPPNGGSCYAVGSAEWLTQV